MSQRICSIEGCGRRHYARGWCQKHWDRWHRHGDPNTLLLDRDLSEEERFWQKVDRSGGESACWVWTGSRLRDRDGNPTYGTFKVTDTTVLAHRWVWEHFHGPIPDGLIVRHSCDNPPCVNPVDLLLGTQADNLEDSFVREHRQRKRPGPGKRAGSEHPGAKLTEADIPVIREALSNGDTQTAIAARYGVGQPVISKIALGKSWRHVH